MVIDNDDANGATHWITLWILREIKGSGHVLCARQSALFGASESLAVRCSVREQEADRDAVPCVSRTLTGPKGSASVCGT